jgi:hypothetical protein
MKRWKRSCSVGGRFSSEFRFVLQLGIVIFGSLFSHTNQIPVGNRYLVEKWGQIPKSLIQKEIFLHYFRWNSGIDLSSFVFFHRLM